MFSRLPLDTITWKIHIQSLIYFVPTAGKQFPHRLSFVRRVERDLPVIENFVAIVVCL